MRSLLLTAAAGIGLVLVAAPASTAGPPGDELPAARAVLLEFRVPANAEVWFDGMKTTQTGTFRQYQTQPLPRGHNYSYQVTVRWMEGDRPQEKNRRVTFRAGDRVTLDLSGTAATEFISTSGSSPTQPAAPTFQAPEESRPHIYNENDYPPPGGPPGGWDHGVGQG